MKKPRADLGLKQIVNRLRGSNTGRPKVKGIASISAKVIRKDGTVEDLGEIYRGGCRNGKS